MLFGVHLVLFLIVKAVLWTSWAARWQHNAVTKHVTKVEGRTSCSWSWNRDLVILFGKRNWFTLVVEKAKIYPKRHKMVDLLWLIVPNHPGQIVINQRVHRHEWRTDVQ